MYIFCTMMCYSFLKTLEGIIYQTKGLVITLIHEIHFAGCECYGFYSCESQAYFKQEHKKLIFFNTLALSCGHLSVFLSSLFKPVVHDSQLSRNETSFAQQG